MEFISVLIDSISVLIDSTSLLIDSTSIVFDSASVLKDSAPVAEDSTSALPSNYFADNGIALFSLFISTIALYFSFLRYKETVAHNKKTVAHNIRTTEIASNSQKLELLKEKKDSALLLAQHNPQLIALISTGNNVITLRLKPQANPCTILKTELIEGDVTGGNWEGKSRIKPNQELKVTIKPKKGISWQQAKYQIKVSFEDELTHDLYAVFTEKDHKPDAIPINQ